MKKTFILGVGAEKYGTTLFSKILNKNKYCQIPLVKEHHVFNFINSFFTNNEFIGTSIKNKKFFLNKKKIIKKRILMRVNKNFF